MVKIPITPLPSTIYTTSTITFNNYTNAYSTVDILQQGLSRVTWCPLYPLTINEVSQATLAFNFSAGIKDQVLPITAYSATVNCGTMTNTWTYSAVDNSTGNALSYATDLISVDATTGSIKVAQGKPKGFYQVKVIGTLPDLTTTY